MRFQLFTGVMAATVIVTSVLPAHANPTDSWINRSALARDARALCDDIVAQNVYNNIEDNTQNNVGSRNSSNNRSSQQANSNQNQKGGKGSLGFGPFSIGGGGQNNSSTTNQTASTSSSTSGGTWDRTSHVYTDGTTVINQTVGKNCKAFVDAASLVDATRIQSDTQRHAIDTNANTQRHAIDTSARTNLLNVIFGASNSSSYSYPGTPPYNPNPYMGQPNPYMGQPNPYMMQQGQ